MMPKPVARKRLWVRRGIPVVVVVLVVGGVFGTRAFASGGDSPSYRLGRVTTGSIDQTLTLSGTAEKVSQATASFKVSGTVKTVPVGIGDTVIPGQTLATLDPTALQQAVTSAKATLAEADATLDNDENGTSSTGSGSSSTSSGASSTSSGASSSSGSSGATPKERAAAAAAVRAAQRKVDADEQTASTGVGPLVTDIAEQAKECAAFLPAATPASSTTPAAGTPPTMDDCLTAVQATITDQAKLAGAQTALQNLPGDQKVLAQAIANQAKVDAAGSSTGSGSGSGSGSARTSTSGGSGGSGGSASSGSGSSDFTAQRVASDQVAVQSAKSALATAEDNLAAATLTAPISGTVAALSFVPGSSSSSASVTIIGAGAVDVTVNVPLASLPKVKVGQVATVVSNGSGTVMAGTVRSISLLPASSTTTSVSYPVVVRVPQPTASLASGSTATATITLATVSNVITVPNSALTTLVSGTGFVQTVKAGKVTRILVRTGAVGATTTQIISGLTVGQQVVIANLSEALPTTTTTSRFGARTGTGGLTSSLSGAGGGLGGGGTFVGGGGGFRGPGG